VACSSPINGYICGGETYTWATGSNGAAITPIRTALTGMWTTITTASGGGSTPASLVLSQKITGGKVIH
jgi:hypothetical protein